MRIATEIIEDICQNSVEEGWAGGLRLGKLICISSYGHLQALAMKEEVKEHGQEETHSQFASLRFCNSCILI